MKNLKLDTCLRIFEAFDAEMYDYIVDKPESALNMQEISAYARQLRDAHRGRKA